MISEQDADWGIIYAALVHAIKTDSGIGFHNHDQGHPAYILGAKDGREDMGDGRDNPLFKMLVQLSETYGNSTGVPVRNWREFCQLAYESHCAAKQRDEG